MMVAGSAALNQRKSATRVAQAGRGCAAPAINEMGNSANSAGRPTFSGEVTMKTRIALLVCFALMSATYVWCQATATIVGGVTDSSGKVIANASVTVTQKET